MMTKADRKRDADYKAEEDLRTLTRAEEVRGDGTRMHAAARIHRKQTRVLSRTGRMFARRGSRA